MPSEEIIVYGTEWCGHSLRVIRFLKSKGLQVKYVDIDIDSEGRTFVTEVNNGFRSVPTIVLTDGSILTEPSTAELAKKLSIE
jgi:glutaredoxin